MLISFGSLISQLSPGRAPKRPAQKTDLSLYPVGFGVGQGHAHVKHRPALPRFGTLFYAAQLQNGGLQHLRTGLFRGSETIAAIPTLLKNHYPNGVTIYSGAAALGHEAVSIALAIANDKTLSPQKYPIVAGDIFAPAIEIAQTGFMEIKPDDFAEAQRALGKNVTRTFKPAFQRHGEYVALLQQHKMGVQTAGPTPSDAPTFPLVQPTDVNPKDLYTVPKYLKQSIIYKVSDILDEPFDPKKPVVLVFRNAVQHIKPDSEAQVFIDRLYAQLPNHSTVILGAGDLHDKRQWGHMVIDAGFKPFKYDRQVYLNAKTIPNAVKQDPEFYMFKKIAAPRRNHIQPA